MRGTTRSAPPRRLGHEVLRQQRSVLAAVAQRRISMGNAPGPGSELIFASPANESSRTQLAWPVSLLANVLQRRNFCGRVPRAGAGATVASRGFDRNRGRPRDDGALARARADEPVTLPRMSPGAAHQCAVSRRAGAQAE